MFNHCSRYSLFAFRSSIKNYNQLQKCSFHESWLLNDSFRRMLSKLQYKYTPSECDEILKTSSYSMNLNKTIGSTEEMQKQLKHCPVHQIDIFSYGANHPSEDFWNVGFNQVAGSISSLLFHVIDGHSGTACAAFLNRACLEYMAASLLNQNKLEWVCEQMQGDSDMYHIVRRLFPKAFPPLTQEVYNEMMSRVLEFVKYILAKHRGNKINVNENMETALLRLDEDISAVALKGLQTGQKGFLQTGMSGAVSVMGRMFWSQKEPVNKSIPSMLHLANTGDCAAVMFSQSDEKDGALFVNPLTKRHDSENENEVNRIRSSHPSSEFNSIIKNQRLLGELAPLRAFGDVRYKWSTEQLQQAASIMGFNGVLQAIPPHYHTPPYLTAKPDVTEYQLKSSDKFLVLGTDGLWDFLLDKEVGIILNEVSKKTEKNELNYASAIAKYALGVMDNGNVNYKKLSTTLALPDGLARHIRDDLTVMVLHIDATS